MPTNNGNSRIKRPSSPYQSQSPKKKSDNSRVWRSLSGTGFAHTRYPELENSKAAWLKSLRLGTGVERSSYQQPVYGSQKTKDEVNLALASSSEYLKQQLGLTMRTADIPASPRLAPGKPQYKSQEDMYDQIIELKKTIQLQKHENDQLKTKLRYNEEDNVKKDKCITQLLEEALVMHNGKFTAKSDQVLVKALKSQQMKSNHKIESLEEDLKEMKSKMKQLKARCKTAKSSYTEEVKKLQAAIRRQNQEIKLLSGEEVSDNDDGDDYDTDLKGSRLATDIKTLRSSIVKTTSENLRLKEDVQLLRKDMEQVLSSKEDERADTEKKLATYEEKISRMKTTISRLKEEKSSVFEENNEKSSKVQSLVEELEESKEEIRILKEQLEEQQVETYTSTSPSGIRSRTLSRSETISRSETPTRSQTPNRDASSRSGTPTRTSRNSTPVRSRRNSVNFEHQQRNRAARKIQTQWRSYRHEKDEREYESGVKLIQSSLRGHIARQECLDHYQNYNNDEGDITLIQSYMRAHNTRSNMLNN